MDEFVALGKFDCEGPRKKDEQVRGFNGVVIGCRIIGEINGKPVYFLGFNCEYRENGLCDLYGEKRPCLFVLNPVYRERLEALKREKGLIEVVEES